MSAPKPHRVTLESIANYLDQPMRELVVMHASGEHGRKSMHVVFNVISRTVHYEVNDERFDTVEEAVMAYNEAALR